MQGSSGSFVSAIKDKVVAITGPSSGIGEATALLLSERGLRSWDGCPCQWCESRARSAPIGSP
jgi:hypothetical protein